MEEQGNYSLSDACDAQDQTPQLLSKEDSTPKVEVPANKKIRILSAGNAKYTSYIRT